MGTSLGERRRHRSWPEDLKREIVAASLAPGSSVSLVARRYDVNANQVFAWRKRYRAGSTEPTALQRHCHGNGGWFGGGGGPVGPHAAATASCHCAAASVLKIRSVD